MAIFTGGALIYLIFTLEYDGAEIINGGRISRFLF